MAGKRDFFISYTAADRAWAEWTAWQLESVGYSALLQAWDFDMGQNFVECMRDALEEAEYTIALLSPAYLASPYCRDEWTGAFVRDADGRNRLLQVRIEDCELPRLLRTRIFVDLVGLSREDARSRLIKAVRSERRKPREEPGFPVPGEPGKLTATAASPGAPRFPGSGPRITNLPPRHPMFCGRAAHLRQLHRILGRQSSPGVVQAAAIHGLGGVGKTQLAIEYAYRHVSEYDVVWWIPAELLVTVPETLSVLARKLGLREQPNPSEEISALWEHLRDRGRWLLIYDNAEGARGLAPYRPPWGDGCVLITSQTPAWGTASTVELGVLREDEALSFLRKRIGNKDKESLAALTVTLGSLPLALEQAASYLDETGATPAEYLHMFHEHGPELLAVEAATTEQTVATTWRVALDQVQTQEPSARDLLTMCAFLYPDNIPKSLFTDHPEGLPEEMCAPFSQKLVFNQLLATVHRYSLVQVSGDSLSVHRLVQTVIRSSLTNEAAREWAARALALVDSAFPSGGSDAALWGVCGTLLPHALEATDNAEAVGAESLQGALLLNKVATFLWARSENSKAKRLLEQALALERSRHGDDLAIANRLNDLGLVLWDMGRLEEARSALEQTLEVRRAGLGGNHPDVAVTLNNLGAVLCDLEAGPDAHGVLTEAIGIWSSDHINTSPTIALALSNLGVSLMIMGRLDLARAALEQSVGAWDSMSAPSDTEASNLSHLAGERAYYERDLRIPDGAPPSVAAPDCGRLTNIATARDQAVEWARKTGQHAAVATTIDNLGVVLARTADLAEARDLFFRGLGIRQLHFGSDHPDVAWSLDNIAGVTADMGELAVARSLFEEALEIRVARLGPGHPDVATTISNLATVLADQGDMLEARKLLERALRIREDSLGEDHPAVARVRAKLVAVGLAADRKD
jgi:tetratricopeptide (TPR) repeat protein